jgi:predicted transcriptional regulator
VVAHESTSFHELVELLSRKHARALPVVDDARHVLGVVCDRWPCDPRELTSRARVERAKAAGVTAREVMTTPAWTVHPEELVADAARRLHAYRIDQLPVVDHGGMLVGIISRFDVLKVFLRTDEEIRFELLDDIAGRLLRAARPPAPGRRGGRRGHAGGSPGASQPGVFTRATGRPGRRCGCGARPADL